MGDRGREQRDLASQNEEGATRLKSSCSLLSIAIVLISIFIVCLFFLIFSRTKNINSPNLSWNFWQKNTPNQSSPAPSASQLSNFKTGDVLSIKITEDDLTKLLKLSDSNFPLKNPSIKIRSDKIVLSGKTGSSFLAMSIDIGLIPKAKEGKLTFEISEMKAAGVPAPQKVTESLTGGLSSYLTVDSLGDINVTAVNLVDGYLLISGTKK